MSISKDDQQRETRLAIQAATRATDVALASWRELMQSTPFDELGPGTQRIAPAIFYNLRDVADFPERFRLRGTFKYAWVRNQQLIHPFLPALRDLAASNIRFCLTKGAALIALGVPYGCRIMSDIDVVVHSDDLHLVENVLTAHSFRLNDASNCPRHPAEAHGGSINFNKGSCRVDFHVAEMREPTRLFKAMLSAPIMTSGLNGSAAPIARPELLALHAMIHGVRGGGETDLLQAMCDIHLLAQWIDQPDLMSEADHVALRSSVRAFYAREGQITGQHTAVSRSVRSEAQSLKGAIGSVTRTRAPAATRVLSTAIQRGKPLTETSHLDLTSMSHPQLYRWWLRAGRLSSLERWMSRSLGGFLNPPSQRMSVGKVSREFLAPTADFTSNAPASAQCQDWRWRTSHDYQAVDCILEFRHEAFNHLDAHVYVNGRHLAKIFGGDDRSRTVYIRGLPRESEFSLRPMTTVCSDCYANLDSMSFTMELVNAFS